jgi:hypothetical protein
LVIEGKIAAIIPAKPLKPSERLTAPAGKAQRAYKLHVSADKHGSVILEYLYGGRNLVSETGQAV